MGAMPPYSTQNMEIHHKPLGYAYERSNKQIAHTYKFILRDISIAEAFQNMKDTCAAATPQVEEDTEDDVDVVDSADEHADGNSPGEDESSTLNQIYR